MSLSRLAPTIFVLAVSTIARAVPVQWSVNGHFYEPIAVLADISWSQARAAAQAAGGYLVTLTSAAENTFVFSIIPDTPAFWHPVGSVHGPWIGAFQPPGSPEPAGGWQWVSGEAFVFTAWRPGEPNNAGGTEHFAHFIQREPVWNDLPDAGAGPAGVRSYVIEYNSLPVPDSAGISIYALAALFLISLTKRYGWRG